MCQPSYHQIGPVVSSGGGVCELYSPVIDVSQWVLANIMILPACVPVEQVQQAITSLLDAGHEEVSYTLLCEELNLSVQVAQQLLLEYVKNATPTPKCSFILELRRMPAHQSGDKGFTSDLEFKTVYGTVEVLKEAIVDLQAVEEVSIMSWCVGSVYKNEPLDPCALWRAEMALAETRPGLSPMYGKDAVSTPTVSVLTSLKGTWIRSYVVMRAFATDSEYWCPTRAIIASAQTPQLNPAARAPKSEAFKQLSSSSPGMTKKALPSVDVKKVSTFPRASTARPFGGAVSEATVKEPPMLKAKGIMPPFFSNRLGGNVKGGSDVTASKLLEGLKNQEKLLDQEHSNISKTVGTQGKLKASKDFGAPKPHETLTGSPLHKESSNLHLQVSSNSQGTGDSSKVTEVSTGIKDGEAPVGEGAQTSQGCTPDSKVTKASVGGLKVSRPTQKRPTETPQTYAELLPPADGSVVTPEAREVRHQKEPGRKRLRRMRACSWDGEDAAMTSVRAAVDTSDNAFHAENGAIQLNNGVASNPMDSEINSFWDHADPCETVAEPTCASKRCVASSETSSTVQPVVRVKVTTERKSKKGKYTVVDTVEEMQNVATVTKGPPAQVFSTKPQGLESLTRSARQQSKLSSFFAVPNGK